MPDLDAYLTFSQEDWRDRPLPDNMLIAGETQDAYEQGFTSIQVRSYKFNFSLDTTETEETNQESKAIHHQPTFGDLDVTRIMDKASPLLFEALWSAVRYKYVALWQKRSGGTTKGTGAYFLKIWFHDVKVEKVEWDASADDPYPKESLTLSFRGYSMYYYPQTVTGAISKDGTSTKEGGRFLTVEDANDGGQARKGLTSADVDRIEKLEAKVNKMLSDGRKPGASR